MKTIYVMSLRCKGQTNSNTKETEMVVDLMFLLLLWPLQIVAGAPVLAKSGCDDKCGSVTISYPFGIGTNCSMGDWFEIECKQIGNNSSKPFLKNINLEVLEIQQPAYDRDGPGLLRVNNPVFTSYCNRTNATYVNFRGSPFVYSQTKNSFAAAGCESRALMADIDPVLSGCNSPCGGCCQAAIPSDLQGFDVTFEGKEVCKYAFLVEKNWPRTNLTCFLAVQDLEYVPAVIEWDIFNSSTEAVRLLQESRMARSFSCYSSEDIIQCYCRRGYMGNAYLLGSCQDINECETGRFCVDATCVNEIGSYRCVNGRVGIRIGAVVGLICGLGLPILMFLLWLCIRAIKKRNKIKRKKMFFKRNGGLLLEQQVSSSQGNVETTKVFSSKELEVATDRFNKNRILGQGGQGTVYKGMLPDGRIVAVKKSKVEKEGVLIEQFINEVVILSQINHRNIVKLLGCCLETEVPLLVYEFIPNGNLFQYLHGQVEEFIVSWEMRLQIATEVGGALSYLHSAASIPIFHRDIKSSNILLDDKYKAKVADFGTSRSISIEQTHLTTVVQGTFGYLDPEYFQSSQYTDKSDVYSFGVVLVELLTGQKAISSLGIQGGRSLATHFMTTMEENKLSDILDPQVAKQGGKHEVMAFAFLARRCLDLNGKNRPTMTEVRMELERISKVHKAINSNDETDHEDIQYARSQEVEPWDNVSASTGSAIDSHTTASADDAQPLLPDPIW